MNPSKTIDFALVRPETASDATQIRQVICNAFSTHPYSDHTEQDIVDRLRLRGELTSAWVAASESRVVGYVCCSLVRLDDKPSYWHGLGPLAVEPNWQRRGVGSALMRASIDAMKSIQADGIVLLGEPAYYGRFGFKLAAPLVLPGATHDHFLCLPLNAIHVPAGIVTYSSAFTSPR